MPAGMDGRGTYQVPSRRPIQTPGLDATLLSPVPKSKHALTRFSAKHSWGIMRPAFNERPCAYVSPKGRLERLICRALFRIMFNSSRIRLDFRDPGLDHGNAEFVIASPRLWHILQIIA